jgi:hypothetical protein
VRTSAPAASQEARLPGEALTRHAVTVITASIVALTFAFSLGNVTQLCLGLGISAWIAWLVGPAVDLSVVGLLTGIRFLSLRGYSDDQLARPRRMLRFCGILTLALNTSGALCHRQFGTTLVDAVGPALLISSRWSPSPCSPGHGNSTPGTARRPDGPSPGTPSASSCGSAATALASWSPRFAPRRLLQRPSPGRCRRPRSHPQQPLRPHQGRPGPVRLHDGKHAVRPLLRTHFSERTRGHHLSGSSGSPGPDAFRNQALGALLIPCAHTPSVESLPTVVYHRQRSCQGSAWISRGICPIRRRRPRQAPRQGRSAVRRSFPGSAGVSHAISFPGNLPAISP